MLRKTAALLLGILMLFTFALAAEPSGAADEAAGSGYSVPDYMRPREFMSMFNSSFSISADLIRGSLGDEEADRLVKEYSLTQYDSDGEFLYYSADNWLIEATFMFEKEEDAGWDSPAYLWSLSIRDDADENAWYLAMYSLNLMIGYTYRDSLGADAVLEWFQTVEPGSVLELPDGYTLSAIRDEDRVMFLMFPVSVDSGDED